MIVGVGAFGQTEILSNTLRTSALINSWSPVKITAESATGGYARMTATSSSLTTLSFDASAYTSVNVYMSVAKYGSGNDGPVTVLYSLNGGTSWATAGNSNTPTSSSYNNSTVVINSTSATMLVRFTRTNSISEKRLRDIVIEGVASGKTVTFKANGGTGADYTQTSATATSLTANTFSRTGYTFSKWNTLASGSGTDYANNANYSFAADLDLYAQWAISQYTIAYDGNGATGGTVPNTHTGNYNSSYTLANNTGSLVRTNYSFNGWNTAANGSGTHYNVGETYTIPATDRVLYAEWVSTLPTLTTTGTVSSMSTVYGTVSTPQSFTFSGANLTGTNVTVSAPAGFEIATSSGGTYSSSLTYAISDGSASGTVYVRLAATTAVGTYAGNISLTAGTTNTTVAIPKSKVTPGALTITGLSASNKVYDRTTAASVTGTATLNGVVTGDTVNVSGTAIGTFADKNVGTGKTVTVSGLSLSGAQASNYTLTQPTTSANITAKEVTISGAVAGNKTYDGNNTAVITGTLSGVKSPDNVTLNGTGTFASSNVGTGIGVTSTSTISGNDAGNYTLTQPIGLIANITKVSLTATADNKTKQVNTANPALTITYTGFVNGETSTTATGFIAPSISTTAVTNSPVGTYPITLSGGSANNYNITLVNGTLTVVLENNTVGDYRTNPSFTGSAIYFNSTTASNGVYPWQRWDGSQWTDVTNSSSAPQSLTTKPENIYCNYSSVNAAGGGTYNNIIVQGGYFYSGNTSTGITIGAGKYLDIKGGYVLIDGRLVFSANSKLAVRENAEFMLGMIDSNFILPTTVSFEIEDNGYVYVNQYLAQIWNGTENFAGNSVVGIYGWDKSKKLFENESDITTNTTTGAKFGYLDIDIADGVLSGNWTYVLPRDNTFTLTLHDFNVTSGDTLNNISLNYGDMTIGGDFIINGTSTKNYIQATAQAADKTLTVNGSIIKNGVIEFRLLASGNNVTTNVKGDIIVNEGVFNVNQSTSGTSISTINLEGDLKVSTTGKISASAETNNSINFKGTGNGLTEATTQTIDIANQSTSPYVVYNVNSGAYVKLINQNLSLGTNSAFNVLSGGTLDFGFAADGITALNVLANGSGQTFTSASDSTLKITSLDGITTTANLGNVQVPVAGRTYNGDATFHYIGKANQSSGNGLPDPASNKKVIVELADNILEFQPNGLKKINDGGYLEIRKGIVLDNSTGAFEDGDTAGVLTMSDGRYKLYKTSTNPGLSGAYNLTGGVVEFANANASDQTVRSKTYQNIEVTGKPVGNSSGSITLQSGGTFTIKNGGEFTINNNTIEGPTGVQTVTVENGGTFKTGDVDGFSGSTNTSVKSDIESIVLQAGSTVEYSRATSGGNQTVTLFPAGYQNLTISGVGEKTVAPGKLLVNQLTKVTSATLKLLETADNIPSNVLEAKGGLQNNGGMVLFENNAQLMQDKDAANVGNIRMERKADVPSEQYNYWSSPVKNQVLYSLYQGIPNNKVMVYNTANDKFTVLTTASNPLSQFAKGYSIRGSSVIAPAVTASFVGEPNNETTSGVNSIELSTAGSNYNLIGNPYPSNLNLVALYNANSARFYNDTDETPTAYLWDNTGNTDLTQLGSGYVNQNYATVNLSSGIGLPAPRHSKTGEKPNGIIRPGQGFIIRASEVGGNLSFENSMRTSGILMHGVHSQYYKGDSENNDKFYLKLTTSKDMNLLTAVYYNPAAENGFERFDSAIFSEGVTENFFSLSSDSKKLSIQGRKGAFDVDDIVPLGVKTAVAGSQKISIESKGGVFLESQNIYLKDKLLNKIVNLTSGDYTFEAVKGTDLTRFEIVYKEDVVLGVGNDSKSDFVVYRDGNDFVVKSSKALGKVEVYDTAGRLVVVQTTSNKILKLNTSTLPEGVFIIKAENSGDIKTKKILK